MPKLRARTAKVLIAGTLAVMCTGSGARAQEATGPKIFSSHCAACHGLDGRGGEHAPNIATNANVQTLRDAQLEQIVRLGIVAAGMPAFGALLKEGEISAVIEYLRTLQGRGAAEELAGDATEGRALFFGSARCGACHSVEGRGGFLGADLSGYGKTHTAAEIREAIIEPNKNLDAHHGTAQVVTQDGRRYEGAIRNEDNFSLQVQTIDGAFHSFDKASARSLHYEPRSLMPDDYGKTLSKGQLDDLIRFLSEAKGAPAKKAEEDEDQ